MQKPKEEEVEKWKKNKWRRRQSDKMRKKNKSNSGRTDRRTTSLLCHRCKWFVVVNEFGSDSVSYDHVWIIIFKYGQFSSWIFIRNSGNLQKRCQKFHISSSFVLIGRIWWVQAYFSVSSMQARWISLTLPIERTSQMRVRACVTLRNYSLKFTEINKSYCQSIFNRLYSV